jgi:hypothetical protein
LQVDPERLDAGTALVAILTNTFDGAAIVRAVLPQPELEDHRIELLTALLRGASPTRQG